jgi:hypothetical protein
VWVVSTRSEVDIGVDLGGFLFKRFMVSTSTRYRYRLWSRGMPGRLEALRWMDPCSDLVLANDVHWIWSVKRGVHS